MNKTFWGVIACAGYAVQALASGVDSIAGNNSAHGDVLSDKPGLQQSITQAIHKFEQTSRKDWSYRISRYENEEGDISSSIELFDPTAEPDKQWTLLQIDNQDPTAKQIRKFARNKLEQAEDGDQQSISVKLRDIIQIESLQLLSEDHKELTARFDVHLSQLGEETSEKLKGSLIFSKNQKFIEAIEITNTEPFSPVFSADINEFRLTFRFIKIDDAILPDQQALAMKGTFAFFTRIDEVSTDRFSDYRYAGK